MGPQRTKLSLRFIHPTRDLAIICRTLGLRPKIIWTKGDERLTPKGRSIGGTRDYSYCSINLGAASKLGLSKKLDAAVKLLKPHRRLLRRLVSEGGRISFYVGWFCDEDTGEELNYEILAQMSDLCIALDLNVYAPER
ncbi:MAG: DUF4279 domain-containing protein [Bryobacteraceae bacterium]